MPLLRPVQVVVLVVSVVALGLAIWAGSILQLRRAILAELQPVTLSNCTLTRVGSANDGGYLMCAQLPARVDAAYSYGVGKNDDWGCEVSRTYGVPVHQYDCFNPARPTCEGGTFVFHDECVGDRAERIDGRMFDTLESQIARNGDRGRELLVKIDIEAAEWDALLATPDDVLASIPQLAMELHGYSDRKILTVIRKLKQHFYVVNLHCNNWSCTRRAWPMKAWATRCSSSTRTSASSIAPRRCRRVSARSMLPTLHNSRSADRRAVNFESLERQHRFEQNVRAVGAVVPTGELAR
jgi:hypothetical protein